MSQQLTPKQQHWSEILESADNSGLSLVEFAKANQLNAQSLYRWRNQLKKNTLETSESVTQFSQVVATSYSSMPSMSIKLHNVQLQFNELPNPEWLARFLAHQGLAA